MLENKLFNSQENFIYDVSIHYIAPDVWAMQCTFARYLVAGDHTDLDFW